MIENVHGRFEITTRVLSVDAENAYVADAGHGAIASFVGIVRNHAGGRTGVTGIFYEAYPEMAEAKMAEVGAEVIARHASGKSMKVSIAHRIGDLSVGEASVVIAIGCERRREALAACADAIERLKQVVPIWKKEKFLDGSEWVGWGGDAPRSASEAEKRDRSRVDERS